ncbi:MAG: methylmalonyl Co-A mutase-associated GTPase MeaB [Flavobacteriales bacterium]
MSLDPSQYEHWLSQRKAHREDLKASVLFPRIEAGDRQALSTAITLIESQLPEHRKEAKILIQLCLPLAGRSIRVGITGVPGVGKSTLIESLGKAFIAEGKKVAVMAIDPSSSLQGGSILGDKTRMENLSQETNAFIRPSPTQGHLGGVAQHTRESIVLCEAAGYDIILVETVGVGQSETLVHAMVDFLLLLMLPGAGDELQGIKRGIVEMADGILITKAEEEHELLAKKAKQYLQNVIGLFHPKTSQWKPKIEMVSSYTGKNIGLIPTWLEAYKETTIQNGYFEANRDKQNLALFEEALHRTLQDFLLHQPQYKASYTTLREKVIQGTLSPYAAVDQLLTLMFPTAPND